MRVGRYRRAVASVTPIMSVEDNFVNIKMLKIAMQCNAAFVNRTFDYTNRSVIERLTVFDSQNFLVSSIMFD